MQMEPLLSYEALKSADSNSQEEQQQERLQRHFYISGYTSLTVYFYLVVFFIPGCV